MILNMERTWCRFFFNVHEGPQSISKFNKVKLVEGMVLSNEPGYYEGENLVSELKT